MIDLGTLGIKLSVDDKGASSKLSAFGDATSKSEGKIKSFASSVGSLAAKGLVAAGAAISAGAASMYKLATESAAATDRIDKMSQKIGMSRETFQEWNFIASQSGMSVEQLQGGFKTLTAQIDAVGEGNKKAIANFERLGVSVTDTSGKLKSQEQVFEEAVVALQGMEDGTEKARLATEIFGKSGSELMPLLNGAAGSIDEMKEKAHELGLVMGDEAIDAGVAFTDQMDQLKRSFGTVVTQVGVELMPIIQKFADWIMANMPTIQEYVSKAFEIISKVISVAVEWIGKAVEWIKTLVTESQTEGTKMNEIWTNVQKMFDTVFNAVKGLLEAFVGAFNRVWNKYGEQIMAVIKPAMEFLKQAFNTAFQFINDLMYVFTAAFNGDWEGFAEELYWLVDNMWENIKKLFATFWEYLKGLIPLMFDIGKDLFTGLWEGLKAVWDGIGTWVGEKVEWLTGKLKFWEKSQDKMNTDGSHRTGLSYVPFDGYVAELHKGERVLTAAEANRYEQQGEQKQAQQQVIVNTDNSALERLLVELNSKLERLPKNLRNEERLGFA